MQRGRGLLGLRGCRLSRGLKEDQDPCCLQQLNPFSTLVLSCCLCSLPLMGPPLPCPGAACRSCAARMARLPLPGRCGRHRRSCRWVRVGWERKQRSLHLCVRLCGGLVYTGTKRCCPASCPAGAVTPQSLSSVALYCAPYCPCRSRLTPSWTWAVTPLELPSYRSLAHPCTAPCTAPAGVV